MDFQTELPYQIGGENIENKTMSMNATHYQGIKEFNVHNFFGHLEGYATHEFLKNRAGVKPFIISRSTAFGSGRYINHWEGDNLATYEFMLKSVSGIFSFNMYGIPMVGADICGFGSNTTSDLCSRWHQVGTFYPFSRNHNSIDCISQEPWTLDNDVLNTSFTTIKFRYAILKHYYTIFVKSGGKGTIVRPLFFEFPNDENLLKDENIDSQMLIGKSLLVTPIFENHTNTRTIYLPKGTAWFNLQGQRLVGGKKYQIESNYGEIAPIFLREGSILFLNNVANVTRVHHLSNTFKLVAVM